MTVNNDEATTTTFDLLNSQGRLPLKKLKFEGMHISWLFTTAPVLVGTPYAVVHWIRSWRHTVRFQAVYRFGEAPL